jgi:hypothetical protein
VRRDVLDVLDMLKGLRRVECGLRVGWASGAQCAASYSGMSDVSVLMDALDMLDVLNVLGMVA